MYHLNSDVWNILWAVKGNKNKKSRCPSGHRDAMFYRFLLPRTGGFLPLGDSFGAEEEGFPLGAGLGGGAEGLP
jgi:hypothetical protein